VPSALSKGEPDVLGRVIRSESRLRNREDLGNIIHA
jgi:hypothetical protein